MQLRRRRGTKTGTGWKFDSEEDLLDFSCKTLVNAGMSLQQIERLRQRGGETGRAFFDKETVGARRFATSELLAAGLSNEQIAKVFRSSKQTVSADRHHIRAVYTESILQNADNWRAKLIEEQDEIKKKAMESFEESKVKRIKRVQTRHGEDIITEEEARTAGDPSFLNVAKGCLEQQARLLGLFDKQTRENDEEKGYKQFLNNLSKEVQKIRAAEQNADDREKAIDAKVEFDDNGEPIGNSRPMLPAQDEDNS